MLTPDEHRRFHDEGYLRLPGLLSGELLTACSERFEVIRRESPASLFIRRGRGGSPVFIKDPQLAAREAAFASLSRAKPLVDAVGELIGEPALFRDVLIMKPAGSGATVGMHQDCVYWDLDDPNRTLSAWIALDDVREEAGCLCVLPGTHKSVIYHDLFLGKRRLPTAVTSFLRKFVSLTGTGDNPTTVSEKIFQTLKTAVLGGATRLIPVLNDLNELRVDPDDYPFEHSVLVPAKAGDAILFHSQLVHGSGPNVDGQDRRAYIATYTAADA